jgi:hypothetical protein
MFLKWMKFSRDAARLGYEVQTVMTLRLLKFARGGKAAKTEARRMVAAWPLPRPLRRSPPAGR